MSLTNFAIIVATITATGAIEKNVACHPKFCIMLAPTSKPTTEPPEYAEPNTPIAIASFCGGNESLSRLNAAGTAAKPTPWITRLTRRNEMLFANPPAIIPAM